MTDGANGVRWKVPRGKVLVLAPHPDDETIGCGGALLLHRLQGDPVKVVFLTDGAAGDRKGHYRGRDYRGLRRGEARRAARVLGVASLEFWDYPDGRLGLTKGLSARLRALLERERPAVVYRPGRSDPHPDHRALAARFEAAARRSKGRFLDCRYEVWDMPKPSRVLDISAVFARKSAAISRYKSQLRYHDFLGRVRRANACRALFLRGAGYAEAYRVKRR
ncbi:MAG: PIG-L family deacetylase [Elusimicrobia bacterium]|nr:PIG-L family deacetylase [Elusimicrobiota bacterium]